MTIAVLSSDISGADRDQVVHSDNAGRRPSHPFGLLALRPGADGAPEGNGAAFGFDGDAVGVEFRAAPERFFDLVLDLDRRNARLKFDQIGDALNAADPAYHLRRPFPLIVPLDRTLERDPPVPDDHANVVRRV